MENVSEVVLDTLKLVADTFTEIGWKFTLDGCDQYFILESEYQGTHENMLLRVVIFKTDIANYHISAYTEPKIPEEYKGKALVVINNFNLHTLGANVCLSEEDNTLIFWKLRTSYHTIHKDDFMDDYGTIMRAVDAQTSIIYNKIVTP